MKRIFTLISALLLSGISATANPVTVATARQVAINCYQHYAGNSNDLSISGVYPASYNGLTTYYTFTFHAGGFVMVSADDAAKPILGYSTEGTVDMNNIPENAQAFFDDYSKEIYQIVQAGLSNTETIKEWNIYTGGNFGKSPMAIVGPWCATTWDQPSPYNNLCPGGSVTGCVATGMAQIMKKWNYPTTGTGSHTYTHATYGALTANFGATTYNWASMINSYSAGSTAAQKTAVATLMYHCGVSVNMNYSPSASGAYTTDIPPALINYFNYQPTAEVKYRSIYPNDATWQTLIKEEMDAQRPVLLAGDNAGAAGSGHEFVCDGYNTSSMNFHINWGWSGSFNAYFSLMALNPSGNNFSSNRTAVVRIQPLSSLVPIADFTASNTIPAIGAPVDFTDNSLNSPTTWLWTFNGGTPATSTLQNPTGITFATNGYHLVSLKVTNASGSDIKTRERYIKVGGAPTVWTKQNSGFATASRGIDQISIVDPNTVWAKAYDGTNPTGYIREFTRTNNAGATWTPGSINFTNSANYGCSNIFPFDYNTAYACMFPTSGTGGAVVKTTDGGATWAIQTTAPFTGSWADWVHFFDTNNGVTMGDPASGEFVIYTTTDGGTTWNQVPNANIPNALTNEAGIVNEYDAVGNTIWFTTNKGRIFKSTDKGVTWSVTTTGLTNSYQMHFKNANVGIIVLDTLPYTIRKTNDGGATWTTLVPTGYLVSRPNLSFVPGTASTWVDVSASPSNGSSISYDDGVSFNNVDTGSVQFTAVDFYDINTGWAGSFNLSATNDGIYKWNNPVSTGINNATQKQEGISIYPIPSKGIVNVLLNDVQEGTMQLVVQNALGAVVKNEQQRAVKGDIVQIDMTHEQPGLYFVTIINGGKTITKKISIIQ